MTATVATGDQPPIAIGLSGCPYRITTYRDRDFACVDSSFGVQVHHPRFLESVGAPESARLLGRPPAEWSQVMGRRNAMTATLELQRDVGLMASNLTVLSQYVMALHRMSLEVFQSLLGREEFPTRAVEEVVPGSRAQRASVQMAAMGLWRPPVGLVGSDPVLAHDNVTCLGCPRCPPGRPVSSRHSFNRTAG